MYKGIIFDLDGTLLDTSEGVLASIRHTIKTMNYRELPLETLLTFIGPPVKRSLMKHYGLTDQEADEATDSVRRKSQLVVTSSETALVCVSHTTDCAVPRRELSRSRMT